MADAPKYYNNLKLSLAEAFRLLQLGAVDRRSVAHTPVVATLDADATPSQRVMILRAVEQDRRQLRFHTDIRTAKASELGANAAASVLVYDPDAKVQLRLSGTARVTADGEEADAAWQQSTLFARRCYLAKEAPGAISPEPLSGLPAAVEGRQPTEEEIAPGRENFAILLFEFTRIEWLYLANSGHRRARWNWDSASKHWAGTWLVP